jgi:hypothetical protein
VIDLAELLANTSSSMTAILGKVELAEDEITAAAARHPAEADLLFHAFSLLSPALAVEDDRMSTDFVQQAHCRELLERVAAGEDTRPGTDAEVIVICMRMSLIAPLNTPGATLYMRLWARTFPQHVVVDDSDLAHWEHVGGSGADDLEREIRRKLAQPGRHLGEVRCRGRHHGVEVPSCRYL